MKRLMILPSNLACGLFVSRFSCLLFQIVTNVGQRVRSRRLLILAEPLIVAGVYPLHYRFISEVELYVL